MMRSRARLAGLQAMAGVLPGPRDLGLETLPAAPRILVIRPDHIGDLLLATPALTALRRALPGAEIDVLCGPWAAAVLAGSPDVDRIETLAFPGFARRDGDPADGGLTLPWQPYRLLLGAAQRLSRRRYHLALVLRFDHWWGAMLAWAASIPRRVGYSGPETSPFLSHGVAYEPGLAEPVQNLRLVAAATGDTTRAWSPAAAPLSFTIDHAARQRAAALLGDEARPLVVLLAGSGAPVKLYPLARWVVVGRELQARGYRIAIAGSRSEAPLVDAIAAGLDDPVLAMSGEPLAVVGGVLQAARLVVGSDSGVLHLAAAVGTAVVGLYGPVDAVTFGPWAPVERVRLVRGPLPCVPCNQLHWAGAELAEHPCVRMIEPGAVLAAVAELLP